MPNNLFLPLLILILLAGCKSKQQIVMPNPTEPEATTTANFLDALQKQAYVFKTISAKTTMEFKTAEQDLASRVDIKMIKDSIIQLSLQPVLGFEVAKIEFGTDSIKMMDRANKQYILENYKKLKQQTQMDFNFFIIQALLSNHIFASGETNATPTQLGRFKLTRNGDLTKAQINGDGQTLYSFIAERSLKLLSANISDAASQYNLKWQYSDFKTIDGQSFPMQMAMQLDDNDNVALSVKISFSRIQTNLPITPDFTIPKNYKRVNLAELAKNLGIK
ncbi:MAG: DUF4292 domain-containing protein [Tannerellaceae bacterium]|nr:DUF4292 domain-containing protein [Tannerellaceae bacterium]